MTFKLKMLDLVDAALDEMDTMKTRDEKAAFASWLSLFWHGTGDSLAAYAIIGDDIRATVKAGLKHQHAVTRELLKDKK